eukprot:NODE_4142_length_1931_cov_3.363636.p2 GENE.NODE_4142_length_1931_cov_3.363636~~NODE_4142_length_1931_cov_3.363636.p2  ORF type:complete len:169 (-),score=15.61 NODE_4142_length_1931_cov_3.363636:246-752(-)
MTQTNHDSGKTRKLFRVDGSTITGALPVKRETRRGAWLPREYVEWFINGLTYRYPGFLASSDDFTIPIKFLEMYRPTDLSYRGVPVLFIFHFDALQGCDHVNLLAGFSEYAEEREWLFQHYSAFRVRMPADFSKPFRVQTPVDPVVVELDVIPNNTTVSDDVPVAKWH